MKSFNFSEINLKRTFILGLCPIILIIVISCGTQKQKGITSDDISVNFSSQDSEIDPSIEEGFKKIVNEAYPRLINDFNREASRNISIVVDTSYEGVAFAKNDSITVSAAWMRKKPEDLDLMTHEIMHIVQAYDYSKAPFWLTEGIADYARYKYGLDNEGAGWSLTPYNPSQNYTDSYRISARFLVWMSQNYDDQLVYKLDDKLRDQTFTEAVWNEYTGKTLDALWQEYSADPKLSP